MNLILYTSIQINFIKKKILLVKFNFFFFTLKKKTHTNASFFKFYTLNSSKFFFFLNFFNELINFFNFFVNSQELSILFFSFNSKINSFTSLKKFKKKVLKLKKKKVFSNRIEPVSTSLGFGWSSFFFFNFAPFFKLLSYNRSLDVNFFKIKTFKTLSSFFLSTHITFNSKFIVFSKFSNALNVGLSKFKFLLNKSLGFNALFKLLNFVNVDNFFSLFFLPSTVFLHILKNISLKKKYGFLSKSNKATLYLSSKELYECFFFFKNQEYQTYSLFSLYHYINVINFFFKDFFGLNFYINIKNSLSGLDFMSKINFFFYKKTSYKLVNFHYKFYLREFIDLLCLSFIQKDLSMFLKWLTVFYEKIYFKLHIKFLQLLKFFFKFFFPFFKKEFGIKGFFLDVRGKLSVSGNSKKRHYYIREGCLSKSNKTIKFFNAQGQVRTKTGVLGIVCFLTY